MSADAGQGAPRPPGDPGAAGPGRGGGDPTEEELRAAYEAELSRITVTDMIAQVAISLLNLAARRLGPGAGQPGGADPAGGRDLEQVRDAIDGVRALVEILERRIPQEVRPLRDALSQLQMAYAAEVRAGEAPAAGGGPGEREGEPQGGDAAAEKEEPPGPGPAESSGRLWVPGQ